MYFQTHRGFWRGVTDEKLSSEGMVLHRGLFDKNGE